MILSVAYATKSGESAATLSNMETMEPNRMHPTVVSVSGGGRRTRKLLEQDIKKAPPVEGEPSVVEDNLETADAPGDDSGPAEVA